MAEIYPFQAVRPAEKLAGKIAALPYDVYSSEEARREVERNPYSFLKVDRAETQFPAGTSPYEDAVYQKAAQTLQEMQQDGELIREDAPSLYLYELTMEGRSQTGFVGCASVREYEQGEIRRHENTRAEKEEDRVRHVDACNAHTGPIFLSYPASEDLRRIAEEVRGQKPLYDVTFEDGVRHRIFRISDEARIGAVRGAFAKIPRVYIADGHHRAASAVRVAQKRRQTNPNSEAERFLAVFFPDDELKIYDYNRILKDLGGYDAAGFLRRLQEDFTVEQAETAPYAPKRKGEFGLYLDGRWYCMSLREPEQTDDPVESLDVSVLQRRVLERILGICDPKTDPRIDFVGGIRGLGELERRVDSGKAKAAVSMYPTSMEELFRTADANLCMPPKSTWFEPKLRSGFFIHELG